MTATTTNTSQSWTQWVTPKVLLLLLLLVVMLVHVVGTTARCQAL
jgi:hypothetical protein